MRIKYFVLLAIITFLPAVSAAQENEFIGYQHKGVVVGAKLPNGVKDLGGGLISDENYGVSRFSKNGKIMLWLEKIILFEKDGVPRWEVRNVLNIGKMKKNQELLFSYSSPCKQNGEENLDLIVLGKLQPKNKTYEVLKTWQVNLETESFEEISSENIVCEVVER